MSYFKYSYCILFLLISCLAKEVILDNSFSFVSELEIEYITPRPNKIDPFEVLKYFDLPDYRNPVSLEDFLVFHDVVTYMMEFAPNETLEVTFEDFRVRTGWAYPPLLMTEHPRLNWTAEPNSLYLLIVSDPDYPADAFSHCGELMHWFVSNIPGLQIEKGDTYYEYLAPIPPALSGLHRYVYRIYKQPDKMKFGFPHTNPRQIRCRRCFRSMEFSTKYKLGNPVAANIFLADYDGYSMPIKKLMGNHLFGPDDNFDEVFW